MAYKAVITIPSGTVSTDLTDYRIMLRLSDMPAEFWDYVKSDGGDIRIKTTGVINYPRI